MKALLTMFIIVALIWGLGASWFAREVGLTEATCEAKGGKRQTVLGARLCVLPERHEG